MKLFARRRIRTPLFPQMEAAECGAASLGVVLAHLGRWVPIEELRTACCVGRDGSSAGDIVAAGQQYGLAITGWRKEVADLRNEALPAILFWEFNHFLVLEGFGRKGGGGST
ncbi:MAG: cysteine peptidase family C39 domain-containing protein [bacterium]|nr:cysteine peptidase family C39 domain-containing protein [bacterium]